MPSCVSRRLDLIRRTTRTSSREIEGKLTPRTPAYAITKLPFSTTSGEAYRNKLVYEMSDEDLRLDELLADDRADAISDMLDTKQTELEAMSDEELGLNPLNSPDDDFNSGD